MSAAHWTCRAQGCHSTAISPSSHLAPESWGWGVDGKPRCGACLEAVRERARKALGLARAGCDPGCLCPRCMERRKAASRAG